MPLAAGALLAAVGIVLLLAFLRPAVWVVVGVIALLLLPGRWWRWRTRRFRRGVRLLERGDATGAREALTGFLERLDATFERAQPFFNLGRRYPYAVAAQANLGVAHLKLGDIDAALAAFAEALEGEPEWVPALFGRALALRRYGELTAAERSAAAALEARPGYLAARLLLGLIRRERGDVAGAEAVLRPLKEDGEDVEELLGRLERAWEG
ncbi:MAG: tetratricopeptide repeat protein [Gemmatimonadota bacterium]